MISKTLICIYFGKLPSYVLPWRASCRKNTAFRWLLVSDDPAASNLAAANIEVVQSDILTVKAILEAAVREKIALTNPYKLCDYRPIFWALLDHWQIKTDFWGHCDLDVVFGNLTKFLPDDLFAKYDKILGNGHLSLIRDNDRSRKSYLLDGATLTWPRVKASNENLGFDEHLGINSLWKHHGLPIYEDDGIVADALPGYQGLVLNELSKNRRGQIFAYRDGNVIAGHRDILGRWREIDFAYMHFQKRKMYVPAGVEAGNFLITPTGFLAIQEWPPRADLLASEALNFGIQPRELLPLGKLVVRKLRR